MTEIFRDCLVENVEDRARSREWRRARLLARERLRRLMTATAGVKAALSRR